MTLSFEYKCHIYTIRRTHVFRKSAGRVLSPTERVVLTEQDAKGDTVSTEDSPSEVKRRVERIIPEKTLYALLCDGERVRKLSSTGAETDQAIRAVIARMTEHELLNLILNGLAKVRHSISKQLARSSIKKENGGLASRVQELQKQIEDDEKSVVLIFDFGAWKARIHKANPKTMVLPGATDCFACEECRLDAAAYRGWSERLFAQGAEGVYLYNTSYLPMTERNAICGEGLTPESVMKGNRRYPLTHHDMVPKGLPTGRRLPAPLDKARKFPLDLGRGLQAGERAFVIVGASDIAAAGEIAVSVNGVRCESPQTIANPAKYGAVRKVRQCLRYAVPEGAVRAGENVVEVIPARASAEMVHWLEIEAVSGSRAL